MLLFTLFAVTCKNPLKIAFSNGGGALLNHVLTYFAVNAKYYVTVTLFSSNFPKLKKTLDEWRLQVYNRKSQNTFAS